MIEIKGNKTHIMPLNLDLQSSIYFLDEKDSLSDEKQNSDSFYPKSTISKN